MIQFYYNKLFKPIEFEEESEIHALTYLMSLLVDELDFRDVLLVAQTMCNMGNYTGVSVTRFVETAYDVDLSTCVVDKMLQKAATLVYNARTSHLDGACFVLTPTDLIRLKLNIVVLPPDKIIKRTHKEHTYILYFYKLLPLTLLRE